MVIGSSAGGIEALCTLLGSLPAGFPAAVVLAQHVDPARPSFLPSILERKTPLPVVAFHENKRWVSGRMAGAPEAGRSRQFVCTAVPTQGADGKVTGVVLYGLDVT